MDENVKRVKQNLMPMFNKAYSLKEGEVFRIELVQGKGVTSYAYKFTHKDLVHQFWEDFEEGKNNWTPAPADLLMILNGSATVVRWGIDDVLREDKKAKAEKPPLGLMPYWMFREKRICDIFAAMRRYSEHEKPIPFEWISEMEAYFAGMSNEVLRDVGETEYDESN